MVWMGSQRILTSGYGGKFKIRHFALQKCLNPSCSDTNIFALARLPVSCSIVICMTSVMPAYLTGIRSPVVLRAHDSCLELSIEALRSGEIFK